MDFGDSVFFTTLLHCVVAYSFPNDNLAVKPGPYSIMSSIPNFGVLQTPSYNDNSQSIFPTPTFVVNPSWHKESSYSGSVGNDKEKNHPPLYNVPETPLKGMGLKYPLTIPKVQLSFVSTNGMLPVNTQEKPSDKPEPPNKELTPAISDRPTNVGVNNGLVNSIKGLLDIMKQHKNTQRPSSKPKHSAVKTEVNPDKLEHPTYPSILYSQAKRLLNSFQFTPSNKPELPDLYLNPTNFNYPQTLSGVVDGKKQDAIKGVSPPYKYFLPGLGSDLDLNINNPAHPFLYYGSSSLDKASMFTPIPNEPGTPFEHPHKDRDLNRDLSIIQHTKSYTANHPGVLKPTFDYVPTKPGYGKEDVGIELPPVPTTMPLLRRTQLVLLNTAAGLPGGNPQALDALRTG